jgi:ABC-type multidrug transport system fused ATPase/permease subunit
MCARYSGLRCVYSIHRQTDCSRAVGSNSQLAQSDHFRRPAAQGSDWWVAQWTRAAVESSSAAAVAGNIGHVATEAVAVSGAGWAASLGQETSLGIYAASAVVVLVLAWLQGLAFGVVALRASRRLHDRALAAVLRATAAWFDSQPTGRILARFAGDIDGVDDALPTAAEQVWCWPPLSDKLG